MRRKDQKRIFNEWLNEHKGLFFKVVRAYAFDLEDREDLFQEISVQVWNSIPKFKEESRVSTWIYRVALYTAIAWVRKEKKHQDKSQTLSDREFTLSETKELKDERLDWLYVQISKLNEIDRSVTLLMLDDYSYKEMANILGISESNIGVKINRIKKYLIKQSEKISENEV